MYTHTCMSSYIHTYIHTYIIIIVLLEEEFENKATMMKRQLARLVMSRDGTVCRVGGDDDDDDDNDDDSNDDDDDDDNNDNNDDDNDDDNTSKTSHNHDHPRIFKDYSKESNGQNRNVISFLCDHSPLSLITRSNFNTTPLETGK